MWLLCDALDEDHSSCLHTDSWEHVLKCFKDYERLRGMICDDKE